jgi:curved DNA-binding protein
MERVDVVVPAGFVPENKIRLAGKGERGGDLLLRVVIMSNPHYHVEASDLIHELKLPAWEAVLGAEVQVTTADGAVRLKIPAGTQPGRRFRLAGRGLPVGAGRRGDFFVQVQVILPEVLTVEEKACWERLGELHGLHK